MDHPHFVLASVKNEKQLISWISKIKDSGLECAVWTEPDKNNQVTAIAVQPVSGEQRRLFHKLQLIRGN